jgi:hypothetical protein
VKWGFTMTERIEKSMFELLSYQSDIRKILEDNSVKDASRPFPRVWTQSDIDRVRSMLDTVFSPFDRDLISDALDVVEDKFGFNRCEERSNNDRCDLRRGHTGAHEKHTDGALLSWRDTEKGA